MWRWVLSSVWSSAIISTHYKTKARLTAYAFVFLVHSLHTFIVVPKHFSHTHWNRRVDHCQQMKWRNMLQHFLHRMGGKAQKYEWDRCWWNADSCSVYLFIIKGLYYVFIIFIMYLIIIFIAFNFFYIYNNYMYNIIFFIYYKYFNSIYTFL